MDNLGLDALASKEAKIRMDFERANKTAGEIDDIADALIKLHDNDLDEALKSVRTAWTGEHANSFCIKYNNASSDVVKSANNLRNTAETIRRMAKNTYDAEMEAIQIARRRTFKT